MITDPPTEGGGLMSLTHKFDMFLKSPLANQTGNVGKVENVGKVGQVGIVGKVGQVGNV